MLTVVLSSTRDSANSAFDVATTIYVAESHFVVSWEIALAIPICRVTCEVRQPEKVDAETFHD